MVVGMGERERGLVVGEVGVEADLTGGVAVAEMGTPPADWTFVARKPPASGADPLLDADSVRAEVPLWTAPIEIPPLFETFNFCSLSSF